MTTTCNSYIQEYSFFDDVLDCINETTKDVSLAVAKYNMKMHQFESKLLFEAADDESTQKAKAEEGKGALAKIGAAVLKLVEKVTSFIKKFTDTITQHIHKGKSDSEKVNQILAQHPELKDQIVEGIDKEWFTVSDVAKFEKDVIGLIQMLNKNAIDHQTFMDRFRAKCQAFTDSTKPIVDAGCNIVKLLTILPDLHKAAKSSREAISAFRSTAEKFGQDVERNYVDSDVNKARAIQNALGQAIGLTTKDAQHTAKAQGRWSSLVNSFCNSAVGKAVHLDDASAKKRHKAAADKRFDRQVKDAQKAAINRKVDDARRSGIKNRDPSLTDEDIDAALGKRKK